MGDMLSFGEVLPLGWLLLGLGSFLLLVDWCYSWSDRDFRIQLDQVARPIFGVVLLVLAVVGGNARSPLLLVGCVAVVLASPVLMPASWQWLCERFSADERLRWLRLQVWAPIWALRNREISRGYRNLGLRSGFSALLVSRELSLDQATRLGWSAESLRAYTGYPARGWPGRYPVRHWLRVPAKRRPEDVEELIRWAQARPDDGQWYAEQPDLISLTRHTDDALPYLTSPLPALTLDEVERLSERSLPYPVFEALYAELELVPQEWRNRQGPRRPTSVGLVFNLAWTLSTSVNNGYLDWWEVPGWLTLDRPRGAQTVFRQDDAGRSPINELKQRMTQWHEVNVAAGAGGPHAVQWWAAGFTVEEALDLLASGNLPDLETLATMAALRGDG